MRIDRGSGCGAAPRGLRPAGPKPAAPRRRRVAAGRRDRGGSALRPVPGDVRRDAAGSSILLPGGGRRSGAGPREGIARNRAAAETRRGTTRRARRRQGQRCPAPSGALRSSAVRGAAMAPCVLKPTASVRQLRCEPSRDPRAATSHPAAAFGPEPTAPVAPHAPPRSAPGAGTAASLRTAPDCAAPGRAAPGVEFGRVLKARELIKVL